MHIVVAPEDMDPRMKTPNILQKRVYAFYIDFLLSAIFAKSVVISYWTMVKVIFPFLSVRMQLNMLKSFSSIEVATLIVIFFGHHMLSHTTRYGQTLGKFFLDIGTIDPKGPTQAPSLSSALIRSFVLTSSVFTLPLLLAIPLLRKDKRSLHCWLSGLETMSKNKIIQLRNESAQASRANVFFAAQQLELPFNVLTFSERQEQYTAVAEAA
jgi:uncharacterized RDD family membrane protein YckC